MVTIGVASASLAGWGPLWLGAIAQPVAQPAPPQIAPSPAALELAVGQAYLGPAGINARILHQAPYNLLGRKIAIGQVEPGRPALFGFDKGVAPLGLELAGLFFRDRPAEPSTFIDAHAHSVASFMVGQGKVTLGVAPAARLYSSALGTRQFRGGQPEECLAMAHVARQNGGDVRAINLSFGESLRLDGRDRPLLDGNALLTQCIDWLAQETDTLFSVAGNQGKGGIPIPTDQFNGVTVAYTRATPGPEPAQAGPVSLADSVGSVVDGPGISSPGISSSGISSSGISSPDINNEIYNKVDFANLGDELAGVAYRFVGYERNLDNRSSVSLVAPGRNLLALLLNGGNRPLSGTSFAAPQVTAAVALLQEYGDRRLARHLQQPEPNWSRASRRHEVMKAVLLNAADKLQDNSPQDGLGNRLGMTKTIRGQNNQDWLTSSAHHSQQIPLDPLFGAGQLNLLRAYEQFSAGQFSPEATAIGERGWDYNQVGLGAIAGQAIADDAIASSPTPASYRDYSIAVPLRRGSYFAATLAWDRRVDLVDRDGDGEYSLGDRFQSQALHNLDLYLLPENATSTSQSIWSSRSSVDSVEHIFHRIPQTGRYKLRVQSSQAQPDQIQSSPSDQSYALAWWGAAAR